jgi:RNA polymerase sigma factor (sigma-70 family)
METAAPGVNTLIHHLFRHESGKMVAVLCSLMGLQQADTAQDLVQDSLLAALQTWPRKGIPENPPAWLMQVAKNKAIDFLRRQQKARLAASPQTEIALASALHQLFLPHEIEDSQLRMMFACCHPAITAESQVAMALKVLCGLSAAEIARAFLTNEETIAKRIYRAKEKIKSENIQLEVPISAELPARLSTVLQSLYLLFNEGYHSAHPNQIIRTDLCEEAMRLCHLLVRHPLTGRPQAKALLALMCLQASRLHTRMGEDGHIILLQYQDRSRWNKDLVRQGFEMLQLASEQLSSDSSGGQLSVYHVEAAIASQHAAARSFEQTDWHTIYHLYEVLYQMQPGPVVAMNKAIASAYSIGSKHALQELHDIKGLEKHHLYYAALGDMYVQTGNKAAAKQCFEKALTLVTSVAEKKLLLEKMKDCG